MRVTNNTKPSTQPDIIQRAINNIFSTYGDVVSVVEQSGTINLLNQYRLLDYYRCYGGG